MSFSKIKDVEDILREVSLPAHFFKITFTYNSDGHYIIKAHGAKEHYGVTQYIQSKPRDHWNQALESFKVAACRHKIKGEIEEALGLLVDRAALDGLSLHWELTEKES